MQSSHGEKVTGYDDAAEKRMRPEGRIPLSLRVGVTGHRDPCDPADCRQAVTEAFQWLAKALDLADASQNSPVSVQVCTPLAAGADQLVAQALLTCGPKGTGLIIPVFTGEAGRESYCASIGQPGSKPERYYREQSRVKLGESEVHPSKLNRVIEIGPGEADDAGFRKLGEWVVDHCDVLLALWDGETPKKDKKKEEPGEGKKHDVPPGTWSIVTYALNHPRAIPVVVLPTPRASSKEHPDGTPADFPCQLLLRREEANPYKNLWAKLSRGRGNGPVGVSLVLSSHRDVLALPDQEERQREFIEEVRSWPLDPTGERALRRTAIGVSVWHTGKYNSPKLLKPMRSEPKENIGFHPILKSAGCGVDDEVRDSARQIGAWGAFRYWRANSLAGKYQQRLRRLDVAVYLLAATSVLIAAARATWTTQGSLAALILSCLDVAVLIAISVFLVSDLRGTYRDRWASFRAMAEYLRTYMFLALIEDHRDIAPTDDPVFLTSLGLNEFVGPAWFTRSMDVIWQRRHQPSEQERGHTRKRLNSLRKILVAWILDQEGYHYRKARQHTGRHRQSLWAVTLLFLFTLVAACLHISSVARHFDDTLSFIAIAVPGFAAAINSIAASREHHRHSIRSRAAAHRLADHFLPAISDADDIRELHSHTHELVRYMLGEATEWYEVMAVHSVDVPT